VPLQKSAAALVAVIVLIVFVDPDSDGKPDLFVYGNGYWLIMQKQNSS
jgi:hypothetical protein